MDIFNKILAGVKPLALILLTLFAVLFVPAMAVVTLPLTVGIAIAAIWIILAILYMLGDIIS